MGFKERLKAGQTLNGSWLQSCSSIVAEAMAPDWEWLCIDVEHSPATERDVLQICQAIRSGNPDCVPFVRIAPSDKPQKYLDAGAVGVIRSTVNGGWDSQRFVSDCYYPPLGRRGVGFCRANHYGRNLDSYTAAANEETVVVVQIEHKDALPNLDSILSVEGIDAAFIGPYDLAMSMGFPGEPNRNEVLDACDRIIGSCKLNGIAAGFHHVDRMIPCIFDGLVAHGIDLTILRE